MRLWRISRTEEGPETRILFGLSQRNSAATELLLGSARATSAAVEEGREGLADAVALASAYAAATLPAIFAASLERLYAKRTRRSSLPGPVAVGEDGQSRRLSDKIVDEARRDTESLFDTLSAIGEPSGESMEQVAAATAVWRIGIAAVLQIQASPARGVEADPDAAPHFADFHSLARSIVRPGLWLTEPPLSLDDLHLVSHHVAEQQEAALGRLAEQMRAEGRSDAQIRALFERRGAPLWLIKRVVKPSSLPWLVIGFV